MVIEIDCPDCDGLGEIEDRKGVATTCRTCKGKGTILKEEKNNGSDKEKD